MRRITALTLIFIFLFTSLLNADIQKESFQKYPPLKKEEVKELLEKFWKTLDPISSSLPPQAPETWISILKTASPENEYLKAFEQMRGSGGHFVPTTSFFEEPIVVKRINITFTKDEDDLKFWCLSFTLQQENDPPNDRSILSIRFHQKQMYSAPFKTESRKLENRALFPKGLSIWHFRYTSEWRVKSFKKYRQKYNAKELFDLLSPSL